MRAPSKEAYGSFSSDENAPDLSMFRHGYFHFSNYMEDNAKVGRC